MRTYITLALSAALALGCGCNQRHDHDHGHEHDHDHDHGKGHHHEAQNGGTLVVVGQEKAHLEVLLDPATGKLQLWVQDRDAKNGVRIPQTSIAIDVVHGETTTRVELAAQAKELTGEKPGDTSEFAGTNEALKGVKKATMTIVALEVLGVKVDGLSFLYPEGNEAEAHGDHDDHDHDDHDHDHDDHKGHDH